MAMELAKYPQYFHFILPFFSFQTIPDLSEMQQKFMTCVDSPDSALGGSPSSAGSSNGQTPRMAIQRPTIIAAKRGGPQQQQQQHQMPIGIGMEAERRFANWNELFQYLRREIVSPGGNLAPIDSGGHFLLILLMHFGRWK
jgi:hypothetical protein